MAEIRDISIQSIEIPETPRFLMEPPMALPPQVPVTQQIGVPIIDIPGCVEAHIQDRGRNDNLREDDPKGAKVFCDGQIPSFNPIDYNEEELEFNHKPPVPPVKPPSTTSEIKAPEVPKDTKVPEVKCPSEALSLKEPIGFIKGDERVTEYRLVGKECIQITEKLDIPTQIIENIPTAGTTTATIAVAVTATTSALLAKPLADLLLRAVKPVTKKVLKKIAALRGKKPPVLSAGDRRAEQRQMNDAVKTLRSVFPRKKK
jgi:hypothetical protein